MSLLALCAVEKLNGAEPGGTITCTVAARAADSGWWSEVLPVTLRQAKMILTFAENDMVIKSTALKLYRSEGSVKYQFMKIQQETGRNPMKFYDLCFLVGIAMQVYSGNKNAHNG